MLSRLSWAVSEAAAMWYFWAGVDETANERGECVGKREGADSDLQREVVPVGHDVARFEGRRCD
jgi:hypothetical protein